MVVETAGQKRGTHRFHLDSEEATAAFGRRLAGALRPGDCLALHGDLGVGKTRLARAVIQSFLGPDCPVPSPTFTLVQVYQAPIGRLWHFDLYRLGSADELFELGWDEALGDITLIEWPERAAAYLPSDRVEMTLDFGRAPDARTLEMRADQGWMDRLGQPVQDGPAR